MNNDKKMDVPKEIATLQEPSRLLSAQEFNELAEVPGAFACRA
jgi:hypothetical protein